MQQYSHDYTLVLQADEALYSAQRLHANDCYAAALERINEARQLLQQYLAKDNMVPDDDVEDGWVHHNTAQKEIEAMRQQIKHYQETQRAMNAVSREIIRRSKGTAP